MADINYLRTDKAPTPGCYSQAAIVVLEKGDKLIFLAGQTGNRPGEDGEPVVGDGVYEQTMQTLWNILAVVKAAGGDVEHIVEVKVFLKDSEGVGEERQKARKKSREDFNTAYAHFFAIHKRTSEVGNLPARTMVWVAEVPLEFPTENTLVEITATAVIPRLFTNG